MSDWRDRLLVEEAKLNLYLLDETHEQGGPKAKFLIGIGFSPTAPGWLAKTLMDQGRSGDAVSLKSPFGTKYTVTGDIVAPTGRHYRVKTVWIDEGGDAVRLVTLIPREE
jgi:hypothetical protein